MKVEKIDAFFQDALKSMKSRQEKIFFSTILLVIRGVGVNSKNQEIMPEFLGEKSANNTDK